eukprot:GHVL01041598.1.p1 GENE.GHVL01041598.1~~GHVL01041598.1.p1  ORF type:complete len:355 (+),score=103.12 GHVL01041598.1:405-1469(+)
MPLGNCKQRFFFKKMKNIVLVTGGHGLLGHAVRWVEEEDKKNIYEDAYENIDENIYEYIYLKREDGDLTILSEVIQIFEKYKPTHVIHLAAKVGGLFSNLSNNIEYLRQNILLNHNVLECCHSYKVNRLICCLSTCIYPENSNSNIGGPPPQLLDESMIHSGPPHPSNEGYAQSKRILEIMCRLYRSQYGYEWICVILTNLYGPYDNYNIKNAHVLPALIHKCYLAKKQNTKCITVNGTGKPLRQFLYSRDAAKIINKLLKSPISSYSFNNIILCPNVGDEISIRSLIELTALNLKYEGSINWDTSRADGQLRKTATNELLMKTFDDKFKFTSLKEGLSYTVEWFLENYDTLRK